MASSLSSQPLFFPFYLLLANITTLIIIYFFRMSASGLENLPLDVLQEVHGYLDPQSLISLALTSKRCYAATAYRLHRELKLLFSGHSDPTNKVKEFTRRFENISSPYFVRRLVISAPMIMGGMICEEPFEARFTYYTNERSFRRSEPIEACAHNRPLHQGFLKKPHTNSRDDYYFPNYKVNFSWGPVARLLEKTKNLTELAFDCPEQFPKRLLKTLHQHVSSCKLYINYFWLSGYHTNRICGYDRMLATSPCLYGIQVMYNKNDKGHKASKSIARTIANLVTTLAPNIRMVIMADVGQATKWNLLGPSRGAGNHRGSLESLTLGIDELHFDTNRRRKAKLTKQVIGNWGAITDFSLLKVLNFRDPLEMDALKLLATCTFSSLETLVLTFPSDRPSRQWATKLGRFLRDLPPLLTLRVYEWSEMLPLNPCFHRHATSLHTLVISSTSGAGLKIEDVQYLGANYLSLESLSVPFQGCRGDPSEIVGYKALGALPNLQYLELGLCALPKLLLDKAWYGSAHLRVPRSWDRWRRERLAHDDGRCDAFAINMRKGHLVDILRNTALDKDLAHAIFSAISSGKSSGAAPLRRLRLGLVDRENVVCDILKEIFLTIAPLWCIEPGCDGELISRNEEDYSVTESDMFWNSLIFNQRYKQIVNYAWPAVDSARASRWQDRWKSTHSWDIEA
ncbi:hypothetical protein BDV59DRAFT_197581 [Aspergillus ambiguus]|uniref:F-box protein n=1 Tax=Aspergillus ambiguus TaxID=176160 RepID=UPI003CCC98B8